MAKQTIKEKRLDEPAPILGSIIRRLSRNPENIGHGDTCASEKIAGKLTEKQMILLLPVLKAIIIGWKGPMQEGEISRAQEYGRKIAGALAAVKTRR
jgi:hypothetical protein